jgi:hypothetical protein
MENMRIGILLVVAIGAIEAPASLAQAQETGSACASIASDTERLTCYDRERCAAIASDAERLACYDRAQRAPATPPAAPAAVAAPAAAAAGAAAAGAAASSTPAASAAAIPAPQSGPVSVPVSPQPSASAASESATLSTRPRDAAATAPPAPVAPGVPAVVEPAIVPIVVVRTRTLPGRPTEFLTDTGQVWVQTDSQRTQLPEAPFNAELKPGAMGSTFLVPADRRAVRVHLRD